MKLIFQIQKVSADSSIVVRNRAVTLIHVGLQREQITGSGGADHGRFRSDRSELGQCTGWEGDLAIPLGCSVTAEQDRFAILQATGEEPGAPRGVVFPDDPPAAVTEAGDQPLPPTLGTVSGHFRTLPNVVSEDLASAGAVAVNDGRNDGFDHGFGSLGTLKV